MLEELKQKVFQANLDLVKHHLVIFTWGNVSGIDREKGLVVIKPSGVEYDVMKASDMVVVDLDGNVVEGDLNPRRTPPPILCSTKHSQSWEASYIPTPPMPLHGHRQVRIFLISAPPTPTISTMPFPAQTI